MSETRFTVKGLFSLLFDAGVELSRDFGSVHAAALGYYILLSIFPLAILAAVLVTRIAGPTPLSGDFQSLLSNIVGIQYSRLYVTRF